MRKCRQRKNPFALFPFTAVEFITAFKKAQIHNESIRTHNLIALGRFDTVVIGRRALNKLRSKSFGLDRMVFVAFGSAGTYRSFVLRVKKA